MSLSNLENDTTTKLFKMIVYHMIILQMKKIM